MCPEQHSGQNRNVKIASKSFEIVTKCNIWEEQYQDKIARVRKLAENQTRGMPAIFRSRIFVLYSCLLFFIGVNIEHEPRVFEYSLENVFWTQEGNNRIPEKVHNEELPCLYSYQILV
jgi:hypothetical protein